MNKNHILGGIRWTLATSLIRRIITLILFYFVAKWLAKEDLGVFREYSLILALFSVIGSLSLDLYYIVEQKRQSTSLLAMWQVTLAASAVGVMVLVLGAGLIGKLYQSSTLTWLLRFTPVFLVVELFRRSARAMAAKLLQFRELALAETWNVVFYSIIAFAILYFVRSVWVYLVVFFLGNAFEAGYLMNLNRKKLLNVSANLFNRWKTLLAVLQKGRIFLTQATTVSLVNQFSGNAPVLILGLLVNPLYIGLYFFASQLIGVPVGMFTAAVNQVFFPVFAGKQDNEIISMATRYLRLVCFVGLPLLLMFSYLVMFAIGLLFGNKWGDAINLIPAMFLVYGSSLIVNPVGGVPLVKRKPGWELTWNLISLSVRVGFMLLGAAVSFETAVWAFAVSVVMTNLAFYLMAMNLLKREFLSSLRNLILMLIPVICYAWLVYLLNTLPAVGAVLASALGLLLLLGVMDVIYKGKLRDDLKLVFSSRMI